MPSVAERIKLFNSNRVPEFNEIKYRTMAESLFRFFRGTCHLFYEDLHRQDSLDPAPLSWICGDLHIENFGSYKGNNRLVYFDLNDFDEAVLAPLSWEIVRMISSIFVAFDSLGIKRKEGARTAKLFLKAYATTLKLEKPHYIEPQTAKGILRSFLEMVALRKQKELLQSRTVKKKGRLGFLIDNARLFKIDKKRRNDLTAHITEWLVGHPHLSHFRPLDVCFRLAGTGSIGMKRFLFLLQNLENRKKFVLLDMKEAGASSVLPYLSVRQPAWSSEAERIISIQYRMQNVSPALLNTTLFKSDAYVLKEMQPIADKVDFNLIRNRPREVEQVIEDMAIMAASSQLRSSGRQGSADADELIQYGQNENWQNRMLEYAVQYADRVKKDYRSYLKDFKAGYFDLT
jgi:uncharacterized protein (DUF2252 family)